MQEVRRLSSGGISVRIRGARSFLAQGEPLYVVDGMPKQPGPEGAFPDLDPRDIKSIEVVDPYTVQFALKGFDPIFLQRGSAKRPSG